MSTSIKTGSQWLIFSADDQAIIGEPEYFIRPTQARRTCTPDEADEMRKAWADDRMVLIPTWGRSA